MKHNGWRKPTPGLVKAEELAQAGERLSIPKTQAIVAMKKVAAAIGLKAPDMLLLDTLSAVTQPQDWEQGRRPIVWASNAFLEEQTGLALRCLQRHVRRLCEAGIISMKDSPNGKRWGKRDDEGVIVEAYGFDLSPLAARTAEFEALHAHNLEERQFCKSLRNTITISRRVIRAKIEKALESDLRGPWRELQVEYNHMIERLPKRSEGTDKLLNLVDWFKALREKVEEAFTDAFDWPEDSDAKSNSQQLQTSTNVVSFYDNMTPTDDSHVTHIQTTNKPNSVNSNRFEEKHAASSEPEKPPTVAVEGTKADLDSIQWSSHGTKAKSTEVELTTVMAACPEFASVAHGLLGFVRTWDDLHRAAGMVRPMVGISEDAWNVAQQKLGPLVAAAAMSLIYEKSATGEVASAGGYLRGIVTKALEGELHLERSFYGRLNGTSA